MFSKPTVARRDFGTVACSTPPFMHLRHVFHIASNHAFVDGNKRTALLSALVFLELNGIGIERDDQRLDDAVLQMALLALWGLAALRGRREAQRPPQPAFA